MTKVQLSNKGEVRSIRELLRNAAHDNCSERQGKKQQKILARLIEMTQPSPQELYYILYGSKGGKEWKYTDEG